MNYIAFAIGLITVIYVIFRFKKTKLEKTKWAYPLLLATFPMYYFVFAIYAQDYTALIYEVAIGTLFIGAAYAAYITNKHTAHLLVGLFCILHGFYDLFHNSIFINTGAPVWWVEFCGSIDLVLGCYLIYLALSPLPKTDIENENRA
jgi:hypothetical protein